MKVNIKSFEQLDKYLFLYRSFLFKFVIFTSPIKIKEMKTILDGLNEKRRKKRIYYVIDKACDYIDNYYKKYKTCQFKNCTCICHREKKKDVKNGCCYKCKYQSSKGCTTKNVACKLFYCSYAKKNITPLNEKDIRILKLLTPKERYILRTDYFSSIEDVTKDIYWGLIIGGILTEHRLIEMAAYNRKKKRCEK